MFIVYIVRTDRNTLYVGQTNNIEKRLAEHNSHTIRSAKYTRSFKSCTLVYSEEWPTRGEAIRRELELKKLTHLQKEQLIAARH